MKTSIEINILESISYFEKKLKQGKDLDRCLKMLREEIEDACKAIKAKEITPAPAYKMQFIIK